MALKSVTSSDAQFAAYTYLAPRDQARCGALSAADPGEETAAPPPCARWRTAENVPAPTTAAVMAEKQRKRRMRMVVSQFFVAAMRDLKETGAMFPESNAKRGLSWW
jgi:hypothetical protein